MINKLKVLFLIILFFHSCKDSKKNESHIEYKNNENWVGTNITFPKSLTKFEHENLNKKSKFNIIVYYNGDCGICYLQLLKWNKIIEDFRKLKSDISFKFILSGNSSAVLKANLDNIGFSLKDVYHDENDEFGEKYSFLLDKEYIHSSMLLDKNNVVLYIGNPTISKTDKDKYLQSVNELK
jgi:hypothetical protein